MPGVVAEAEIDIAASAAQVWQALTDPEVITQYFFGTTVQTDWQVGSAIVWKGEYEGTSYEDEGEILEVEPGRRLKLTHYSPMTGAPDEPESYHTLTYVITERGDTTHLVLSQDNNGDEAEAERAGEMWTTMLAGLKKTVESQA